MTIRRDVDKLVRQRGLIKTIGGIQTTHAPEHLYESPVQQRLQVNRLEKEQIARVATAEIGPRQTIFLDGSTTCMILARHLAKKMQGLTVVTYSPLVCMEFGRATGNTVFCLGGQFDPISACFAGPATEEEGRRYFVDRAFFSTKGFLPAEGTFESSLGVFRIKQIVAAEAARVILLVDHTKFGQRALQGAGHRADSRGDHRYRRGAGRPGGVAPAWRHRPGRACGEPAPGGRKPRPLSRRLGSGFFAGAAALRPGKGTGTVAAARFPREGVHFRHGARPHSGAPLYSSRC